MNQERQGYIANSASNDGVLNKPVDLFIYCQNTQALDVRRDGEKLDTETCKDILQNGVFYEVATTFQRFTYDKEKETTAIKTTEYRNGLDPIVAKNFGVEFYRGDVNGFKKLNTKAGSTINLYCVMEWQDDLYNVFIAFKASARNVMFANKFKPGSAFKLLNRETTKEEVTKDKFGEHITYAETITDKKFYEEKDFSEINKATESLRDEIRLFLKSYFENIKKGSNMEIEADEKEDEQKEEANKVAAELQKNESKATESNAPAKNEGSKIKPEKTDADLPFD